MDFKLPELEIDTGPNIEDALLHNRHKRRLRGLERDMRREQIVLHKVDSLAQTPNDQLLNLLKKSKDTATKTEKGQTAGTARGITGTWKADAPGIAYGTADSRPGTGPAGGGRENLRTNQGTRRVYRAFSPTPSTPGTYGRRPNTSGGAVPGQSNRTTTIPIPRSSSAEPLNPAQARARRVHLECKAELATVKYVVKRKPGDLREKFASLREQIETEELNGIDDDLRESTLDHPKLGSVEENLEDLRHDLIERWCAKRGKETNEKYTNKEKRLLRKWFKELDYDGSGEVNVEELQDPMLSSGILKTREQVVRVLANVDKNHTMGIDFEEFIVALSANKLADQRKLRKLQEMSADPYFDVETLITAERRKKLIKSVLKRSQDRQRELDALYKKYDKPKLSRRERELLMKEQEVLEDKQQRSIFLHMKYLNALDGVLQERKAFYMQRTMDREHAVQEQLAFETAQQGALSPARSKCRNGDGGNSSDDEYVDVHQQAREALEAAADDTRQQQQQQQQQHDIHQERGKDKEVLHNPYSIYAPSKTEAYFLDIYAEMHILVYIAYN